MRKRFLYQKIYKYLHHKNALVITGMRQVGKTTLMRQLFDEVTNPKLWFDFDNPLEMLVFEDINYDAIYNTLLKESGNKNERLFVFIDEIQNLPEITKIIKYMIDKFNVKFVVTGSSNYYLKNLFPESLSGRKFLFILRPMNFQEYLFFNKKQKLNAAIIEDISINTVFRDYTKYEFQKLEKDYSDFLEYGGFPEVVVTENYETKRLVLKNIFSSFFEKDIRLLSDLKNVRELRNLILLLVPRTGNILDVSKLSSDSGISRLNVYNYLEFLQGVFLIKLIPKFSQSVDRSVAGGKKVYFSDTGLLNLIGRVNDGQLFENAVANQLSSYGELSYYNRRNKAEIDFIVNKEIAFEAKLKATAKDLNRLDILSEKIGIKKSFLISQKYVTVDRTIFPMFI